LNGKSSTIDFNDKPDDLPQCFNNSIQTSNNDTNTNSSNQYEMRRDALNSLTAKSILAGEKLVATYSISM
jgi:hypothetical protein